MLNPYERERAIDIAMELGYTKETIRKLSLAEERDEILLILSRARANNELGSCHYDLPMINY